MLHRTPAASTIALFHMRFGVRLKFWCSNILLLLAKVSEKDHVHGPSMQSSSEGTYIKLSLFCCELFATHGLVEKLETPRMRDSIYLAASDGTCPSLVLLGLLNP